MSQDCHATPYKLGCIDTALEVVGDKWSALLLKAIAESESGSVRFCDFESIVAGISPRTLSQRLQMLQDYGVLAAQQYSEHPQRFHYSLTPKGHDLVAVIRAMVDFTAKYAPVHSSVA